MMCLATIERGLPPLLESQFASYTANESIIKLLLHSDPGQPHRRKPARPLPALRADRTEEYVWENLEALSSV